MLVHLLNSWKTCVLLQKYCLLLLFWCVKFYITFWIVFSVSRLILCWKWFQNAKVCTISNFHNFAKLTIFLIFLLKLILHFHQWIIAVSYTHLDVYKRQEEFQLSSYSNVWLNITYCLYTFTAIGISIK